MNNQILNEIYNTFVFNYKGCEVFMVVKVTELSTLN